MDIIPTTMQVSRLPFILPKIEPNRVDSCCWSHVRDDLLDHAKESHSPSIQLLAYAIQTLLDPLVIKRYIESFSVSDVSAILSQIVANTYLPGPPYIPILFFAVQRNSPELVRTLCKAGARPEERAQPSGMPLLIYTIISAEYESVDHTDTLVALLAMGANPADVPVALWENYLEAPGRQKMMPSVTAMCNHSNPWCTRELLDALCRNLTLMQRYFLHKARLIEKPTPRMLQVARAFDFLPLFETTYHIIGQNRSTQQVLRCLISHYLYDAETPLVILLTGMSGHGKTELAKRMGNLLSLAIHRVDMTEMKHETDLFGPKKPYYGHQIGTVLNNFLATHSGKRCVVFLDEFEKTTNEVRQAMLLLLESGFYKDRRTDKSLDCTKVIWILAANLGETSIEKFWATHLKDQTVAKQNAAPYTLLQRELEIQFTASLGAPITGRLSAIIPFFPFSAGEQAVTTYKFMRELWTMVRGPIDVSAKKFARHSYLNFINDSAIALHLAKKHYSPQLGARSLEKAVHHDIRQQLAYKQMEDLEEWKDDMNERRLVNFDVKLVTAKDGSDVEVVEVVQNGLRDRVEKDGVKEENDDLFGEDSRRLSSITFPESADGEEL